MGANTKDGAQLTGLLTARKLLQLSPIVKKEYGDAGYVIFSDWLFDLPSNTVTGSLAITDSADTFAASGSVRVVGTLAVTDSADVFAASGSVTSTITGSIGVSDSADILAASGIVIVSGSYASQDGADTFAATGNTKILGAAELQDLADVFSASGSIIFDIFSDPTWLFRRRGRR